VLGVGGLIGGIVGGLAGWGKASGEANPGALRYFFAAPVVLTIVALAKGWGKAVAEAFEGPTGARNVLAGNLNATESRFFRFFGRTPPQRTTLSLVGPLGALILIIPAFLAGLIAVYFFVGATSTSSTGP
jgi:hypothetical protein